MSWDYEIVICACRFSIFKCCKEFVLPLLQVKLGSDQENIAYLIHNLKPILDCHITEFT